MNPEEVRHDGSMGSSSSPVEAASTLADMMRSSRHWTDMLLEMGKVVTSIFSLGPEMFVRPLFGSTYYDPVMYLMGVMVWGFCTSATLILGGSLNGAIGLAAITLFNFITLGTVVFQGYRFYLALNDYSVEADSRLAGRAWGFFSKLPGGDRWGRTRILYEPVLCALVPIGLWTIGVLNEYTAAYYVFAAACLSLKNILAYYDVWRNGRKILDDQAQLPFLQALAQSKTSQASQSPTPPQIPVTVRPVLARVTPQVVAVSTASAEKGERTC